MNCYRKVNDTDFYRELESAITVEKKMREKRLFICILCKEKCTSEGLQSHETLKPSRECFSKAAEKIKINVSPTMQICEFEDICKKMCKNTS